jgi:hypothetical protein
MQAARISASPRLEYATLGQATRMAENSEGPSRRRDALEYARFLEDLSGSGAVLPLQGAFAVVRGVAISEP